VTGLTLPKEALLRIKSEAFDLVITDVEMPQMRGTELLAAILAEKPSQLVLLITAFGSIDLAVSTVQSGACDFIAKPFKIESLVAAIERAFHNRQIRREIVRVRKTSSLEAPEQMVAGSPRCTGCSRPRRRPQALTPSRSSLARPARERRDRQADSRFGARRERPFYHLNCASLPPPWWRASCSGAARAFTDAKEDRAGAFVAAGTVRSFSTRSARFPGGPSEASPRTRERMCAPLGSTADVPIRARLIAATNRSLETCSPRGTSAGLYYG